MDFTYSWANEEKTQILRSDGAGIPLDPDNRDYAEFLASGVPIADFVAPEPPAPPTPEEKLAASGLTVDELKSLLRIS